MNLGLFRGCLIPYRFPEYELSTTKILSALGVPIVDVPDFTCCGSQVVESFDEDFLVSLSARNLAIAQARGVDSLVTMCGSCTYELNLARENMLDPGKRARVNAVLDGEGLSVKPVDGFNVWHFVDFLSLPGTLERLEGAVVRELPLRVALQEPCMASKPPRLFPEQPFGKNYHHIMDLLGVEIVEYPYEKACCGGTMLAFDESIGKKLAEKRYDVLREVAPDLIVTACPNCQLVYHVYSGLVGDQSKNEGLPPSVFFTQLVGLGLGIPAKELGLERHFQFGRIESLLG
ncbi:MAG: heterodisulfide reductase-related iron-sulfur binding cluster [Promethearchaeota archaeon]